MPARLSSQEAFDKFMEESRELWEKIDRWMDEHPEASLKEIEQLLRPERRELLAQLMALQLAKRGAGAEAEAPVCPSCGRPLEFEGYRWKPVSGMELEGKLPLAYYHCPHCGEGFFPPEPGAGANAEALE